MSGGLLVIQQLAAFFITHVSIHNCSDYIDSGCRDGELDEGKCCVRVLRLSTLVDYELLVVQRFAAFFITHAALLLWRRHWPRLSALGIDEDEQRVQNARTRSWSNASDQQIVFV